MKNLNLETLTKEQELVKSYLEENASDSLADKINNGVTITKDNKTLLNKKDLTGFMKFANEEARKLAEKGANCACVEDKTVFGWAIHYFEEDSIEGNLYNEDGSEYKVEKPIPKVETKTQPKKPENKQATLFDLFSMDNNKEKIEEIKQDKDDEEEIYESEEPIEDDDEWTEEEMDEALKEIDKEFVTMDNQVVNTTTGEVINKKGITNSFDEETKNVLYNLLEGKMEMR